MKDMVLVPVKFVIFLLAVLCAGISVQVLIDFSRLSPSLQQEGAGTVSLLIVNGFFTWVIPATVLTWLFSSFAILRTGKAKRTRMIFLTFLIMGTLFSILYMMPALERVRGHLSELDFQVPENTILSEAQSFFVFSGSKDGANGTLILHRTEPDARFRIVHGVTKDLDRSELLVETENLAIPMDSVIGGRQSLFEDPGFMNPIAKALLDGISAFQKGRTGDLVGAALLAGATALLLASFWLFVRLTQWPLANCLLSLAGLCGVLLFPAWLASPFVSELLEFIPAIWKPYLLPGIYLLLSLVCFGGILLLPSRKDWQPGVNE